MTTPSPRPHERQALAGFALAACAVGVLLLVVRMFGGLS